MVERSTASEFLYSQPEIINSEAAWLYNHGKKADTLTMREIFQHTLESFGLGKP